jgi:hypothetical protein
MGYITKLYALEMYVLLGGNHRIFSVSEVTSEWRGMEHVEVSQLRPR